MKIYRVAQVSKLYHGSNSEEFVGPIRTNVNDPGWFGTGFYATAYPEHAKVYGKYIYEVQTSATKFAEVNITGNHDKITFVGEAKKADEIAGGTKKWLQNDSEWAHRFTEALKSMGYDGIRVNMNGKPDGEVLIFDASKVNILGRIN